MRISPSASALLSFEGRDDDNRQIVNFFRHSGANSVVRSSSHGHGCAESPPSCLSYLAIRSFVFISPRCQAARGGARCGQIVISHRVTVRLVPSHSAWQHKQLPMLNHRIRRKKEVERNTYNHIAKYAYPGEPTLSLISAEDMNRESSS
jgi:hypothetical protein